MVPPLGQIYNLGDFEQPRGEREGHGRAQRWGSKRILGFERVKTQQNRSMRKKFLFLKV